MAATDVEYCLFVGRLAWSTEGRSLEKAFSAYGEVIESKVNNDRETGRLRGFGFMAFGSEQAMMDAVESMNWQNRDGRSIIVNQAQFRGAKEAVVEVVRGIAAVTEAGGATEGITVAVEGVTEVMMVDLIAREVEGASDGRWRN